MPPLDYCSSTIWILPCMIFVIAVDTNQPNEALEAIANVASVLREHWAAAKAQPVSLFWPRPGTWWTQLTTAPAAEDSSGTLPDPHPC